MLESEIFIFGCLVVVIITVFLQSSANQRRNPSQKSSANRSPPANILPRYRLYPWGFVGVSGRPLITPPPRYRQTSNLRDRNWRTLIPRSHKRHLERNREKTLVERWRKAIVELVRLADRNLKHARECLEVRNYRAAIEVASTGVENISRALIHCYGGRPDLNAGQEEALRMLSGRFKGDERVEFERAIDNAARISHNKTVLNYLSKHNLQLQLLDEAKASQILLAASNVDRIFKQILIRYFASEIPEFYEICPACGSSNANVNRYFYFRQVIVNYQCNSCTCEWTQPC